APPHRNRRNGGTGGCRGDDHDRSLGAKRARAHRRVDRCRPPSDGPARRPFSLRRAQLMSISARLTHRAPVQLLAVLIALAGCGSDPVTAPLSSSSTTSPVTSIEEATTTTTTEPALDIARVRSEWVDLDDGFTSARYRSEVIELGSSLV